MEQVHFTASIQQIPCEDPIQGIFRGRKSYLRKFPHRRAYQSNFFGEQNYPVENFLSARNFAAGNYDAICNIALLMFHLAEICRGNFVTKKFCCTIIPYFIIYLNIPSHRQRQLIMCHYYLHRAAFAHMQFSITPWPGRHVINIAVTHKHSEQRTRLENGPKACCNCES